jgi:hypothetical protein
MNQIGGDLADLGAEITAPRVAMPTISINLTGSCRRNSLSAPKSQDSNDKRRCRYSWWDRIRGLERLDLLEPAIRSFGIRETKTETVPRVAPD